jgi:HEAT repeat protein
MLNWAVILAAILFPVFIAAAFLLGRHLHRRQEQSYEFSAVTRQHIDLFQGGHLSETAVEAAKTRLRELLDRGEWETVEASLRPGTHYVVLVRALMEIGTEEAGRILERQLQRRLTNDLIEQSWYWIDLAQGLRTIQREQSVPHLLRCAESGGEHPLSHFFAAETVCFLSFAGYLRQPQSPLGRSALRVLHSVLEGLRCGVQPQVVVEARLGELIEGLWDHRPDRPHPLIVLVVNESLRLLQRAPHAELLLADEAYEQEAFGWQLSRLTALEPAFLDYIEESPRALSKLLTEAPREAHRDILRALLDLHAECAEAVLPLLEDSAYPYAELAVNALAWSRNPRVGPWLREWTLRCVHVSGRARRKGLLTASSRNAVPEKFPYAPVLKALRGHASSETEAFLLLAAHDREPSHKAAAVGSLGWWEPFRRDDVIECLQEARHDPAREVRLAARGALGRLGECQALAWFRQALTAQDTLRVHEAIQAVASEGLTILWPDLDRLADSENVDISIHACEALERMREHLGVQSS